LKLDELRRKRDLSRMVDMIVSYDIHYALLEAEFADVVADGFFTWKARWYLQGHFPCGVTTEGQHLVF
jgi:hypothetical protein